MAEEIKNLTGQVAEQAEQRGGARLLLTHPGVGPVTALATEVFLGDPRRFADGKALASYVGMIPREYSSGERQRLGGLTKQGSPLTSGSCYAGHVRVFFRWRHIALASR
jgi:transposase